MGLGINALGNNWKYIVLNFVIVLLAQIVFSMNDLMNTPNEWPTVWLIAKSLMVSLSTTLVFYGFNKEKTKDGGTA